MKKFIVYTDDGCRCDKVAVPAKNAKAAADYATGWGEVVRVKDVTSDFPIFIDKVRDALVNAHFGEVETDLILRTLSLTDIAY